MMGTEKEREREDETDTKSCVAHEVHCLMCKNVEQQLLHVPDMLQSLSKCGLSLSVLSGDQSHGATSPVPLKKDVENMEKGKDCLFEPHSQFSLLYHQK